MNAAMMVCRWRGWHGLCLCLLVVTASQKANAQLAGRFRSAPGTLATYEYHFNGYQSVMLPADMTVSFSGDSPTSMLTATIYKPIIGDTQETFDYPIVNAFPMVVTGTSSDGRHFHGDLLGTQYLFDWKIEPAADGQLLWNGQVECACGRYELTTITDAPLIAALPGDYNDDGTVDAADYVLWRNGGPLRNEFDAPGTVNGADYTEWQARFGNSHGSGTMATSVPEPPTLLLTISVFAALASRRRKLTAQNCV